MSYVYVAAPLTHKDADVVATRLKNCAIACGILMRKHYPVLCPNMLTEGINVHSSERFPTHWEYWRDLDLSILRHAKMLLVVQLEGWDTSVGVTAEIQYAHLNDIPILYIDPLDLTSLPRW